MRYSDRIFEINKTKGLIIDVGNNSGGDSKNAKEIAMIRSITLVIMPYPSYGWRRQIPSPLVQPYPIPLRPNN